MRRLSGTKGIETLEQVIVALAIVAGGCSGGGSATVGAGGATQDGGAAMADAAAPADAAASADGIAGADSTATEVAADGEIPDTTAPPTDVTVPPPDCAGGCDDGLACTTDTCLEGTCQHTVDAGYCVIDGACVEADTPNPDDPCAYCLPDVATDRWSPVPAARGIACDDGDPCTADDQCAGGACAGTPLDCDDGIDCTTDACDPTAGACTSTPDDSLCDDGDPCTGTEACDPTAGCTPGTPVDCDDGIDCTTDACDPASGACTSTPDDTLCDDGDPCTVDACGVTTGCVHETLVGCSGVACTADAACDDGIDCTTDTCDAIAMVCTNVADDALCDDGSPCDGVEVCGATGCETIAGTTPACGDGVVDEACGESCDDGNTVDGDGCSAGCLSESACVSNTDCDDGDACTQEACSAAGYCVQGAVDCDDGDTCTLDTCDPTGGCVHEPLPGCVPGLCFSAAQCDDGNPCTVDLCNLNVCSHLPSACDDGDACTADLCQADSGDCTHLPKLCYDGNACAKDDCDAATGCVHEPLTCDDNDPCTIDLCLPQSGCTHSSISWPGGICP